MSSQIQQLGIRYWFRVLLTVLFCISTVWFGIHQSYGWLGVSLCLLVLSIIWQIRLYQLHTKQVLFMINARENNDNTFHFPEENGTPESQKINRALNRVGHILYNVKAETAQQEKYYELIMNSVNTGIIVLDDNGVIFQTNNEALRLLGMSVFTNVRQLGRIDENLENTVRNIQPGDKHQISFTNERGNVHLSIRVSEMTLQEKHVRILAINDINSELDEKEIDSWIRLTRVLTHEIMNSVTPITSLSDTLLSLHENADDDIRSGLEVISTTGKSLISFVESYRKFTHIPTPEPSLFYVQKFVERMVKLARHHNNFPNITINVSVEPSDLIVYADENLISQVVLNLLKNAMQAIGSEQEDGLIEVKAYCNEEEAVLIEVSNNGPVIPQEEAEHIFVPFFTTKEGGSGIGLSISRQIMRLSGGSIALKSAPAAKRTTFILTFP